MGYQNIRYEYQRWPLWRWDLNCAYIKKSFSHKTQPTSVADKQHYESMRQWIEQHIDSDSIIKQDGINIAAVGDVMWIRQGWDKAFSPGVEQVLSQASLTINNMETPIVPNRPVPHLVYETLHYNAPVSYLDNWQRLPTNSQHIFSLCNNHALDQGVSGLTATREAILAKDKRFHCVGGLEAQQHYQIVQVQGIKIGVFSSTFGINHLINEQQKLQSIPIQHFGNSNQEPGWKQIEKTLEILQSECDVIIYYPHWSYEYEYWPDQLQRQHALRLIELGVDIIIGHSPHVLQPIDYVSINNFEPTCPLQVKRAGPAKRGMIAWSLGNFLSIMPTMACKTGAILQLSLKNTGHCWSVDKATPVPIYTTRPDKGTFLQRQVMLVSELPKRYHHKRAKIIAHCNQLFPTINNEVLS